MLLKYPTFYLLKGGLYIYIYVFLYLFIHLCSLVAHAT